MTRLESLRRGREEMTKSRERIYALAEGRSEAELLRVPDTGGWCGAQVLDHLRTGEAKLVRALLKVERGEPTKVPRRAWLYRLPMAVAFPPFRVPAPTLVRPRAAAELKPHELLEALRASRRDLLAYADRLGEEAWSRLVFPHFLLGRFDGRDWFWFLARHEGRHAGQLERILSATSSS